MFLIKITLTIIYNLKNHEVLFWIINAKLIYFTVVYLFLFERKIGKELVKYTTDIFI